VLQDVNTRMLAGAAVLVGVGAALGLAGIGVGAAAFVAAARRWYERNDLTPLGTRSSRGSRHERQLLQALALGKVFDRTRYAKSAAR
jgi:hypothetical protein